MKDAEQLEQDAMANASIRKHPLFRAKIASLEAEYGCTVPHDVNVVELLLDEDYKPRSVEDISQRLAMYLPREAMYEG